MPACSTKVTQDRSWGGSVRNQGSRSSITATDRVASPPAARSTRRRVSAETPGTGDAGTGSVCPGPDGTPVCSPGCTGTDAEGAGTFAGAGPFSVRAVVQTAITLVACGPLPDCSTSKLTFWPSSSDL